MIKFFQNLLKKVNLKFYGVLTISRKHYIKKDTPRQIILNYLQQMIKEDFKRSQGEYTLCIQE